jgi:two-component system response regulator FimZ (fimbrial Z protein)
MLSNYEKSHNPGVRIKLSAREKEILSDLYRGLSRAEIAVKQALSVNTVNSAVNNIYNKLGAHSIVDVVRITAEEKLV